MQSDAILGKGRESIPEKQRRWVLAPQLTEAGDLHNHLHQSCSGKLCRAQTYITALYICVIVIGRLQDY